MQTFIPYSDHKKSAESLDYRRLGKQRVECLQILNAINHLKNNDIYTIDINGKVRKRGWLNHPCTQMWKDNEGFLIEYALVIVEEWRARGYNDSMKPKFERMLDKTTDISKLPPSWWGREDIHFSHRCQLVAKDKDFYGNKFPDADPSIDYVWA